MDYIRETTHWQPRDRRGYWMNRAKDTKDGLLSSLFVVGVATILLATLYLLIYINPDYVFISGILIVMFYAIRTIIRDIFEWV